MYFIVSLFQNVFIYFCIPHCIPVINIVKKYQLNSTGMNFHFTDFLTAKVWLKKFGEYLKKLLKVLPFSNFFYRFAENSKNWIFWNSRCIGEKIMQRVMQKLVGKLVGRNIINQLNVGNIQAPSKQYGPLLYVDWYFKCSKKC